MGTSKEIIKAALITVKTLVGAKRYYVAMGGAMMSCFFLFFIVNIMTLKILFLINAIFIFVVVLQDDDSKNIFEII